MGSSTFVVRASSEIPGAVSFEVLQDDSDNSDNDSENQYLTVQMYGDEIRQDAAQVLASVPDVLADAIPTVVDYAIGRPTGETNFEGAGFNYSPMIALRGGGGATGAPTKLQLFTLEKNTRRSRYSYGVRSLFGTYWRSQHWDGVVSQSPHLLDDETWRFQDVKNQIAIKEFKKELGVRRGIRGANMSSNITTNGIQ